MSKNCLLHTLPVCAFEIVKKRNVKCKNVVKNRNVRLKMKEKQTAD